MATKSTTKTKTAVKESKQAPVNVLADTVEKPAAASAKPGEKLKETSAPRQKETAKTAEKKAVAKKTAAKKDIKIKTYVEYMGRQVEEKDMVAAVKKSWTKEYGKKVGDIKDIALYIKPEDGAVYYVVNGKDTGSVQY